jgi:hypothetical protein
MTTKDPSWPRATYSRDKAKTERVRIDRRRSSVLMPGTGGNRADSRQRRCVRVLTAAFFAFLLPGRAHAQDAYAPPPRGQPGIRKGIHLVGALTAGSCTRDDANVGAVGFCGEALVGVDHVFLDAGHFDVELGAGFMPSASQGYPDLGVAQGSGGGYGVARLMLGYDLTSLYFVRGGAQLRTTYSLHRVTPGVQLVADVGTRVLLGCAGAGEVGARLFVGSDGIAFAGEPDGGGNGLALTLTYGVALLVRYLSP